LTVRDFILAVALHKHQEPANITSRVSLLVYGVKYTQKQPTDYNVTINNKDFATKTSPISKLNKSSVLQVLLLLLLMQRAAKLL